MIESDAFKLLKPILETDEPAGLGPQRRPSALSLSGINGQLDELTGQAGLSVRALPLVRSLGLLWHDHLDASHAISQSIESADGSYLHGIMHRREPDFGNAAYWFRRVGQHPVYPSLAEAVTGMGGESHFISKLVRDGEWQPLAFIDACEAVEVGSADDGDAAFLRDVQALEFRLLLQQFCED